MLITIKMASQYATVLDYIKLAGKTNNPNILNQIYEQIEEILDKNQSILDIDLDFKDALKDALIDAIVDYGIKKFIPLYIKYIDDMLFLDNPPDIKSYSDVNDADIERNKSAENINSPDKKKQIETVLLSMIPALKRIYNDPELPHKPPIPAEKVVMIENEAKMRYKKNQYFINQNKPITDDEKILNKTPIFIKSKYQKLYTDTRVFIVGEIVGVQDNNGKWWMARILDIYKDNACCSENHYPIIWYYVHFEGQSDFLNEWVSHGMKIQKYNPKKHFYRRPTIGGGLEISDTPSEEAGTLI